jgi:hypothetical protein
MRHTHSEITDPHLRLMLANELLVLRFAIKRVVERGGTMDGMYVSGVRVGLDTFARRIEDVEKHGMKVVYRQNYPE